MATSNNEEDRKLRDIFQEAFHLYSGFENNALPCNSLEFQLEVKKCIHLLETATRLVSLTGMFSTNEKYDEINTDDLRYFLLPFLLGKLTQRLCTGERHEVVEVSEVYFKDFLKRAIEYGLHEVPDSTVALCEPTLGVDDKFAELQKMAQTRNAKIEAYRRKKELDEEIGKIKELMAREHTDESVQRDFYVKLLRASVIEANEELASCAQESQILQHMKQMRDNDPNFDEKEATAKKQPLPLRPIIITRDAVQKAVYGAGYPSLPTMSVDEFYEKRVADGIFPDPTAAPARDPNSVQARAMRGDTADADEEEKIRKELGEEQDDEEYLARARGMDDFKDEVRRGDGNRHNRS